MRRIILFDTSIATENLGDEIIMESAERELAPVIRDDFIYHLPTHLVPVPLLHQASSGKRKLCDHADFKFICGTNLFWADMRHLNPLLNANLLNARPFRRSVLFGVGIDQERCKKGLDAYSRSLWKTILSKETVHSARDDRTVEFLEQLGLKAVNTGCPTLWMLTPEHCAKIPVKKAEKVVFTLSNTGGIHPENDRELIGLLRRSYKEVWFFAQTYDSYRRMLTYEHADEIRLVPAGLDGYRKFLREQDVDYVGTRLHGGIFAMQQGKRAVILKVDHRADDFAKFGITQVDQFDLKAVEERIHSEFKTQVTVDYGKIADWLGQFR